MKKANMIMKEIQIYSNRSNPSKTPDYVSCSHTKLPQVTGL